MSSKFGDAFKMSPSLTCSFKDQTVDMLEYMQDYVTSNKTPLVIDIPTQSSPNTQEPISVKRKYQATTSSEEKREASKKRKADEKESEEHIMFK